MTVEETRAQLEKAKDALNQAIAMLGAAGESYTEAAAAMAVCGQGSVHEEPARVETGLGQAKSGTETATGYANATIAGVDAYSSEL